MRWSELAAHQPALAPAAHDQLIKPGVVLAGTTRRDGSARISGVEPLIMDDELWLSMMPTSAKAGDLRRDRRILVHSVITSPSPLAEIMLRGTVWAETATDVQRRYAAAVRAHLGWQPVPGEFALFAMDACRGIPQSSVSSVGFLWGSLPDCGSVGILWGSGQDADDPAQPPS
jgi:hypothetical protein